jgi:hypothetical protein
MLYSYDENDYLDLPQEIHLRTNNQLPTNPHMNFENPQFVPREPQTQQLPQSFNPQPQVVPQPQPQFDQPMSKLQMYQMLFSQEEQHQQQKPVSQPPQSQFTEGWDNYQSDYEYVS